ncbi:MAG TPA: DUF1653 domain-containing protein [Candidatus Gracilibacteria bacterium]|nr:DUF1653 domain-containing protein [Candidatus Gracilibacteria bacterium]
MSELKKGIYRHFKGGLYEVIDFAHDCENSESEVVIYKALYPTEFGETSLWVREKLNFLEILEKDGKSFPRFEFIGEK